jgi:hypothetical protein
MFGLICKELDVVDLFNPVNVSYRAYVQIADDLKTQIMKVNWMMIRKLDNII